MGYLIFTFLVAIIGIGTSLYIIYIIGKEDKKLEKKY